MHYTHDILLKKRSSDEGKTFNSQFMQPFHRDVWFALLVTLVVISVSTFALNILVHMDTKIRMAKEQRKSLVLSIACGLHGVVCFSKVLKLSPEAYQVLRSKVNKP